MDLCQRDPYSHNFSIKYSELDLYQRDPDSHNFSIKDLGLDLQVLYINVIRIPIKFGLPIQD